MAEEKKEEVIWCPIAKMECKEAELSSIELDLDKTYICAWQENGECLVRQALEGIARLGEAATCTPGGNGWWIEVSGSIDTYEQN